MSDISKINSNGTEYNLKDATARTNIGNLSNLETTEKTDLVSAVNELKSGLTNLDYKYITTYSNTIENVTVGNVEYGSKVISRDGLYLINATIETNSAEERTLHLKAESDSVGVVFYGAFKIKANCSYGGILELSVLAYIPANSTIKFTGYAYSVGDNLTVNASFCRMSTSAQQ